MPGAIIDAIRSIESSEDSREIYAIFYGIVDFTPLKMHLSGSLDPDCRVLQVHITEFFDVVAFAPSVQEDKGK